MVMCVFLCYPVSIHMSQLLSTGSPISSCNEVHQQVSVNVSTEVSSKLPLRHGCMYGHTAHMQRAMCMSIFIAGCCDLEILL